MLWIFYAFFDTDSTFLVTINSFGCFIETLYITIFLFYATKDARRQVIRTKSVKYMPFLLSFFLTISAVMWFFYGLLKKDCYIAIPNVLGFSFGIVQMVLYAIYKNSKEIIEDPKGKKLADLTSDQIIEVVKLNAVNVGGQEIVNAVELPALAVMQNNNEGIHAIEIHCVHEPEEKTKKVRVAVEAEAAAANSNSSSLA
ncbi:hypothetical protein Nepgr_002966 [Nepenthes gracilis]|uniref:Bidirectional sugar transporter SWEET n=1 Tax=Nepenthes gracilis TaxID=150966 RepID=A0AAD3RYN3_NEPGR|nr:hypothetical protein Nepgr_002966 [Nepenthes gracilis]